MSAAREALQMAVAKLVERKAKGMDIVEICAALGIVAGATVATAVPAGNPDADLALANMLGLSFGEAVKLARQARAN